MYYAMSRTEQINEIYRRLQAHKKKRKAINDSLKDALAANDSYRELVDELKTAREAKKSIESQIKESLPEETRELKKLDEHITADTQLLADLAFSAMTEQETVEIADEERGPMVPQLTVKFIKKDARQSKS